MGCTLRFSRQLALGLALAIAGCGDNVNPGTDSGGGGGDVDAAPPSGPDGGSGAIDREQSGGAPTAVALVGDLTYVAVGPRLAIWRAPAGAAAELVGESAPLAGVVTGLAVAGDRAYVAERVDLTGRIHILDVSDPARPVETGTFALSEKEPSVPVGMAALGDRLFVADSERGVAELDVSDPDAPSLVRTVPHPAIDVQVAGSRLYYVGQSFIGGSVIGALDLDGELADLGEVSTFGANGIAVAPGDLLVTAGADGIHVLDASDLTQVVERLAYVLPDGGPFARAVAASGTTAWIPAEDGLYVLDLSDPTAIEQSGPYPLASTGANDAAAADGALAVVTDRGRLLSYDISTPGEPVGGVPTAVSLCADCTGVAVAGDLLVASDFSGGVRTGQVDDLALLGGSTEPDFVVFEDVAIDDGMAYVADWSFGLRIYDVSDPSAPSLVGQVDTAGFPSSVSVVGARAYLGESTNGGNLRIIDVSDPAAAVEIGSIATSQARDVEVRGGLAFVADGSFGGDGGGMRIFDVSAPSAISLVGYYSDGCSEALDIALAGTVAVVACAGQGFHVVDISDPARPTQLAVVPPTGIASAWSVTAWPGGAALGDDFGVTVIDLATPSKPAVVAVHAASWTVRALAAPGDGRLVASCGLGGVYQWALP